MSRTLDRDDEVRSAADRCIAEFLDRGYSSYLTLVRAAQARPENRAGSDKSWVERAMREYQQHYRDARRVE